MIDFNKQMEMVLYHLDEENVAVDAYIAEDSIWVSQKGMSEIFGVGIPAISKHLKNIFNEGELSKEVGYFQNGNNHKTWCNRRKNTA